MSTEPNDKIVIEWDDLNTRKVEQRLKEQEALERNRRQAELNPLATTALVPGAQSIWYNSIFLMACFGLIGGLLAWGGGEILHFRADPEYQADAHYIEVQDLQMRKNEGRISPTEAQRSIRALKENYADNPFFVVMVDPTITDQQRAEKLAVMKNHEKYKRFLTNVMSFGFSGMLIALCLSIAEPLVDRNPRQAVLNGSVGAATGLVGGAVVSLIVPVLFHRLTAGAPVTNELSSNVIIARSISWGVLGFFLTIGPGLIMRNIKKLAIGLAGGLIGGLIGGALFDPILSISNDHLSRLVALVGIGLFAGLGTGLIENAAKNGWLQVTAGLIAGKQFILYRNPTFIGSGPECPIYLFKDPKVGKRHAAIHIVPGGFELENLPMGTDTKINGRAVDRTRLRGGDEIQVGMTTFQFQEKVRT